MHNILIIGGAGYIGSALASYLAPSHTVKVVSRSVPDHKLPCDIILMDYDQLTKEMIAPFDVVVLLAGHSSVSECQNDPVGAHINNVRNFSNLLTKITTQKFIYASSAGVYGNNLTDLITEDCANDYPINEYDLTKINIDRLALASNKEYYGLRFGTVAGPSSHARTDLLVNAMVDSALMRNAVSVQHPDLKRSVLGIRDLCRAVETIIRSTADADPKPGVFNLASQTLTVGEIGRTVSGITHAPVLAIPDADTPPAYNFSLNTTKFQNQFDFEFMDTVDSIVRDLIASYTKQGLH